MLKKTIKIADLIIETGLTNSGTPGAEKIYSFAKLGASFVRDYIYDQSEKKAYEFHKHLLLNDDGELHEDLESSQLDASDYHSLFSACLADIEQEKSGIYGNLAKMIATNRVPKELRRHFILKLKEITWDQLDILARTYVICNHRIMPRQGNWDLTPKEFLESRDPFSAKSIDIHYLNQNKFLAEETITKLGSKFIKACFPQDLLTPGAYNYNVWLGASYAMISLQEQGLNHPDYQQIEKYFREKRVQGNGVYMEGLLERSAETPFVNFILIAYHNGKKLNTQRLTNLERIASRKAALQVIFTKDVNEAVTPLTNTIPHIAISESDKEQSGPMVYEKVSCILHERKVKNAQEPSQEG